MDLDQLLIDLGQNGASDLILKAGTPPIFRIGFEVLRQTPAHPAVDIEELESLLERFALAEDYMSLGRTTSSYEIPGYARFRIDVLQSRGQPHINFHLIPICVPTIEEMNLPETFKELCQHQNGLLVLSGQSCSGKTTTAAAILQNINQTAHKHIMIIEEPIEFVFENELATFTQIEIGYDYRNHQDALQAVLRHTPDVLFIDKLDDPHTLESAIIASQSCIVLGTCLARSASTCLEMILTYTQSKRHLRKILAEQLRTIICQMLIPRADGGGRVAAIEQLPSRAVEISLETGSFATLFDENREGFIPFNKSLKNLYNGGLVNLDAAIKASPNPEELKKWKKKKFGPGDWTDDDDIEPTGILVPRI